MNRKLKEITLSITRHVMYGIMRRSALKVMFIMHSCILLILISHNPLIDHHVFAESSPFSQEINSGIHIGIRVEGITHAQTKPDYKGPLDISSDIQRVTYFSDGKTLNATICKTSPCDGTEKAGDSSYSRTLI
jgi:hypothetical protein